MFNYNMVKAISLGVLAAFFFSSTFVINRWLSIDGDNWYWTASLRYFFVILILTPIIFILKDASYLSRCVKALFKNGFFWLLTGGIGFGVFYLTLCYSASFAPGWVIATTWQLTIIISPLLLRVFKFSVKLGSILFSLIAFIGVFLVNYNEMINVDSSVLKGSFFVLIAAISYPFGISLCKLAMSNKLPWVTIEDIDLLQNTFVRVWLMAVGCLPVLLLAGLFFSNFEPPSINQIIGVGYVAISTGVVATSLLFYACQNVAKNGDEISAVLCTQSFEVPFAMLFEILFLSAVLPGLVGWLGVFAVIFGASGYILTSNGE